MKRGADTSAVEEAVRAGKRCAVLVETFDSEEHLVRFAHHRFQEYFSAI
jgi:hypothetical protein